MIDVVEGCQSLFQNTLARVKEGVRDKLSHSGIDYSDVGELDSAFDLPDPFKGPDTIYLQDTSKNKYVVTGKVSALQPLAGLGEVCSNVAAVLLFLETTVPFKKCDPVSENPTLRANIEFELEATLSVQVIS